MAKANKNNNFTEVNPVTKNLYCLFERTPGLQIMYMIEDMFVYIGNICSKK